MDKMRSEMPFMDEFGISLTCTIVGKGQAYTSAILFRMCFDLHHKHDSREAKEYSKVVILLKINDLHFLLMSSIFWHILAYLFAYLAKPLAYYGRFP